MSEAPKTPYPPDLEDDAAAAPSELGDLTDVVVANADWANGRARATLRRVELQLCRLTGAELGESSFTDVTFADCRLDLAALRFASFERVVFRDCRMAECDLYGASLTDVVFERCELREAVFETAKVERVELRGCDLAGATGIESLAGARLAAGDVLANAYVLATALGLEIVE